MKQNKNNDNRVVIEGDLQDHSHTSLNGTGTPKDVVPTTSDKAAVWRKLTLTFTIIATSLTLTFSWQKRNRNAIDNKSKTEMQIAPVVAPTLSITDSIK